MKAKLVAGLGAAGMGAAVVLLWRGMRGVLEIGGTCAQGGPYVVAEPCPDGIPAAMLLAILGGAVAAGCWLWGSRHFSGGWMLLLAWPVLFLALGWNFLEYGIDPPGAEEGPVWGWLVPGVLFVLMGGAPLVIGVRSGIGRGSGGSPVPDAQIPAAEQVQQRAQLAELDRLRRSGVLDEVDYVNRRAAIPLARYEPARGELTVAGKLALVAVVGAGAVGGWLLFDVLTS